MAMIRRVMPAQVTALGEDEVEIVMSTATVARDGHVLVPAGADLTAYRHNPIVLWNHDVEHPVGRAEEINVGADKITARVRFAPMGISHKADEIRGLVKSGIISGVSVGFEPTDGEPLDKTKPRGGMRITAWELLETSFCAVPVDTEAMVTARASGAAGTEINFEERVSMSNGKGDRSLKAKHSRALERAPKVPAFKRGLYEVGNLAYMLEQLGYAHACNEWEADIEGDDSQVPAMLGEALVKLGEAFLAMTKEEVTELLAGKDLEIDEDAIVIEERAYVAAAKTAAVRAWRTGIATARAGKMLSSTNEKKLQDAQGHHERAIKHLKSLGEHHEAVAGNMDAITASQEKAQEQQAKVGEHLQAAKDDPENAPDHVAKAAKANKAVGGHLDEAAEAGATSSDRLADAGDSHAATGRSVKSAQRCVRGVVEGSTPGAEDGDDKDIQTSSGDAETDGSKGGRSVDFKRRQLDLKKLLATM